MNLEATKDEEFSERKESSDTEGNEEGLIRTCHLCGKAQCGQRRGRVRCAYCKRVFCLQQLFKKFKIKANATDTDFKCPRCLGICCCVTNCQKPPPHVHCKVYKVRQNKRKNRELLAKQQMIIVRKPIQERNDAYTHESAQISPKLSSVPMYTTGFDGSSSNLLGLTDSIPGIQHNDWLTQLNLQILDSNDQDGILSNPFSQRASSTNVSASQLFVDRLRDYMHHKADYDESQKQQIISFTKLYNDAMQLQSKAEKTDTVFRMVDSFNKNTIQARITWRLNKNTIHDRNENENAIPGIYTIVRCYPSVLFSLETDTIYGERDESSNVCITFFNTSSVKDIRPICTCIHLMDLSFHAYQEIESTEVWTEPGVTWKTNDNIDMKMYQMMSAFGEEAQRKLLSCPNKCRIYVSYSRNLEDSSFESLPIMSLLLKKVSVDYPSVIYCIERMYCDANRVLVLLLFSEEKNWVKIINGYETNLEVSRDDQYTAKYSFPPPLVPDI